MKKGSIGRFLRFSKGWFLFSKVIFFYLRLFYRKIEVEGTENIPKHCPIIFAPNHQNALMDPLVVLYGNRMQTTFLARADVFKVPILRDFFHWLKMLPVFRLRDGAENLQNNDLSFNIAVEVLENRGSVGIFPEATHTNLRRLLPIKKGIPRLAFLAESKNDFSLGIKIVPVGIHYSNYENMHSTVHIRFGEPISVAQFKEEFHSNQQKAMLLLRDEISKRISALAINIRDAIQYETIYRISELFAKPLKNALRQKGSSPKSKFESQLAISRLMQNEDHPQIESKKPILEQADAFINILNETKIHSLPFGIKPRFLTILYQKIVLILLSPLYLFGFINNLPNNLLLQRLLKKFDDRQFHSSIKFVWGLAVVPLFFVLQGVLVVVFTGNIVVGLAYLASLPAMVLFSKMFAYRFSLFLSALRLMHLKWLRADIHKRLVAAFNAVLDGLILSFRKP